ncbi:unnamed protein product [Schistocephalus solidus]|uniref:AP2/ERF domain-containing protein n=1 Tax=Schistocephalus solidus TaxID=70667 RepID=A0A183SNC5_SCHSO|nr:unnamed protein product [Schistocephalus solidus]
MSLQLLIDREQKRRHKDTLKNPLIQLKFNWTTWKDLTQNRLVWRRSAKTGVAIYEDNWMAFAEAKRVARKSQAPRICTANAQALPNCSRSASIPTKKTTPTTKDHFVGALPPTMTDKFLPSPLLTTLLAPVGNFPHIRHLSGHFRLRPPAASITPITSDGDLELTCFHCDRTLTSNIGSAGH